jgi:diguanylate cyclase (GGDEF)-like protein
LISPPDGQRLGKRGHVILILSKSLQAKLTLLLLLIGLLPLAVGSLFSFLRLKDSVLERQYLELDQELSSTALSVESLLEKTRSQLLLVAQNSAFEQYFAESDRGEFWLKKVQKSLYVTQSLFPELLDEATFVQADGREILRIVQGRLVNTAEVNRGMSNPDFFKTALALAEGEVHQGEPYFSLNTHQWVIPYATPVIYDEVKKAGLVHFGLSLTHIQEILQARIHGEKSAFIVDENGDFIIHSDYPGRERELFLKAITRNHSLSFQAIIQKMMVGERGFERYELDSRNHYAAFQPIRTRYYNPNRWSIGISVPVQGVYVGKGIVSSSMILFLTTLIAIILLSYRIGQVVTQPIRTLVSATEKVAQGDLTQVIPFKSKDDLGILAHSFNEMVEGLRQREEFRSLNLELTELAITDGLTGLYNHRYLQDRLEEEIQRSVRSAKPFALLFCDLDNFKSFNDLNGHHLGDSALKEVAQVIRNAKRSMDIAARYGGEEFALILPETDGFEAKSVGERLRREVEQHAFEVRNPDNFRLTVSIGITVFPQDGRTKEELLERADLMMYYAKCMGRNQVHVYEEGRSSAYQVIRYNVLKDHSSMSTLRHMASMVETKDHYSRHHSESVPTYAMATAYALGLNRMEVHHIGLAALLHDLGKIGISDEILSKKGPLSPEEMARLRAYPLIGAEILKRNNDLKQVLPMILHHRERFDGDGYPAKLKGEKIPLGARIIAVAEAYYAMVSDRPYRKAMKKDEAIAELKKCAGSQFDPKVVDSFIRSLEMAKDIPTIKDLSSYYLADR